MNQLYVVERLWTDNMENRDAFGYEPAAIANGPVAWAALRRAGDAPGDLCWQFFGRPQPRLRIKPLPVIDTPDDPALDWGAQGCDRVVEMHKRGGGDMTMMQTSASNQKHALRFAELRTELERAEQELTRTQTRADNLRTELGQATEALKQTVGPNQPRKMWKVAADAYVLVEHHANGSLVDLLRHEAAGDEP